MWKLRNKEKKYERKPEIVKRLERIAEKEEKLEMIRKTLKELKETEENHRREMQRRKETLEKEKKKKLEQQLKKEHEKKNRLEKQKILGERWAMLRWITQYIKENQDKWAEEKLEREKKDRKELEEWLRMKRFEKITKLKKKWQNKPEETTEREKELEENEKWSVWRKKTTEKDEKKSEIDEKEKLPNLPEKLPTLQSKLQLKPPRKNQTPTTTKPRKKLQPDKSNQRSISSIFKKVVPDSESGGGEQLPQADPQRDGQSQAVADSQDLARDNISLRSEEFIPGQSSANIIIKPGINPGEPDLAPQNFPFLDQLSVNPETK